MHSPEALILRRYYSVQVTFVDLRAAFLDALRRSPAKTKTVRFHWHWTAALKEATGAIDEVYAVVDGREVRVGVMAPEGWQYAYDPPAVGARAEYMDDLFDKADREGYWTRPHEVRLELGGVE